MPPQTGMPRASARGRTSQQESFVLDVIYVLATLAIFAVVGLVAKGVEKLGPRSGGSTQRAAVGGGDRG